MFSTIFKIIGSILLIMFFTGIIVGSSVLINIFKMADNTVDVDLHTLKLDLTSFIYVNDENGNPVEYQSVYAGESRIWVDYDNIPEAMKTRLSLLRTSVSTTTRVWTGFAPGALY